MKAYLPGDPEEVSQLSIGLQFEDLVGLHAQVTRCLIESSFYVLFTLVQFFTELYIYKNDVMRLGERPRSLEGKPNINKPKLNVLRFEGLLF